MQARDFLSQNGIILGTRAKKKNTKNYSEIIKALVPMTVRVAGIYGDEGITVSTVRHHGLRLGIINANTPLHFLSSVMKASGLVSNGTTRPSTIKSTKGRRQMVYYSPIIA